MDEAEGYNNEDALFQIAAHSAQRIVSQCRAHVGSSLSRLSDWTRNAPPSSPWGKDRIATGEGEHALAHGQRISQVEAPGNALSVHLRGLEVLMKHDTFYPLPAVVIARSIAEVAATTSWLLNASIGSDERAARAYAALFRSIQNTIDGSLTKDKERIKNIRERSVTQLAERGIEARRRVKNKVVKEDIAEVIVGRSHAKTLFQYTQRIAEEIPQLGDNYSLMSGISHGEQIHVSASWENPAVLARLIGVVVLRSVEAWSRAVYAWVAVEPAPFYNPGDVDNLIRTIPAEMRAEFDSWGAH